MSEILRVISSSPTDVQPVLMPSPNALRNPVERPFARISSMATSYACGRSSGQVTRRLTFAWVLCRCGEPRLSVGPA
jgi:hypothetical protein